MSGICNCTQGYSRVSSSFTQKQAGPGLAGQISNCLAVIFQSTGIVDNLVIDVFGNKLKRIVINRSIMRKQKLKGYFYSGKEGFLNISGLAFVWIRGVNNTGYFFEFILRCLQSKHECN